MRLIDADKFKEWIDAGHLRNPSEICLGENNVINMIDLQPTAYDIDKVVSELKLHKNNEKMATSKLFDGKHRYYRAISVTKAIKIVNEGCKM
jgi:hypothetical protein